MTYNPLTFEKNWEIQTAEKGTRYAVVRSQGKGDVAFMPYGLTQDCKSLATMVAATPHMVAALQAFKKAWDDNRLLTSQEVQQLLNALDKATFTA